MRIEGPYRHRDRWRCRLVIEGTRSPCPVADTPEEARRLAELWKLEIQKDGGVTVEEAIVAHLDATRESGATETSVRVQAQWMRRFFASVLRGSVSRVTPTVIRDIYEQLRRQPGLRGRLLSAATHRAYLSAARRLMGYCVEQGWLKSNPALGVKPVGKKQAGKSQLSLDELRALWACCLEAAPTEPEAVAVLAALGMGLRAGEVVKRTVRSVDDGGRLLRLEAHETKNKKARAIRIPQALQPLLRELARGKRPDSLLWPDKRGGAHPTSWLLRAVRKYCTRAGVPVVCSHSLRGSHATTALTAGATPDLVASVLGHHHSSVTLRHYAQAGSAESAQQEARVLTLEKKDPDERDVPILSPPLSLPPQKVSARR